MTPVGDMSPEAAVKRQRASQREEVKRAVFLQDHARTNLELELGAARECEQAIETETDEARRAELVDRLLNGHDPAVEARRAELAACDAAVDRELERLHAGDLPPDPLQGKAELADAIANLDDEQARAQEADGLGGAGLRRRAERLRSHAATLRASLRIARPTLGLTVARRSPASSGRPRARRTASAARAGPGDDPGSDEPEPGNAGHPPPPPGGDT